MPPKRHDVPGINRRVSSERAHEVFQRLKQSGDFDVLLNVLRDSEDVAFERLRRDYSTLLLKDYNAAALFQANQGVMTGISQIIRLFNRLAAGSARPFQPDDDEL